MANPKGTKNESTGNADTLDMSDFVTELPEGAKEIALGSKLYKFQFCGAKGGLQGIVLDSEQKEGDYKTPENPTGLYTSFTMLLTKPAPCVEGDVDKDTDIEDVEFVRGEPGERVRFNATTQIEEDLARYLSDPKWYAEVAIIPTGKTKTKKGSMYTFRMALVRSIQRSELDNVATRNNWNPSLNAAKATEALPAAAS